MDNNRTNQTVDDLISLSKNDWRPYDQAAAAISLLLATCIIGLNGLVIYTLTFREHKKSRLFFFMLHLAIADLLVGFVCVFADGIISVLYGAWYGGDVFCRLWRYSKYVLLIASNNLLIGMSVDRYIAVRYPLNIIRVGLCSLLDRSLVIGAWVVSLLAPLWIIPYLHGVNGPADEGGGCNLMFDEVWMWKLYVLSVGAVIVLLPLSVITVCYTGICIVVWRKWRQGLELYEIRKDKSKERLQGGDKSSSRGILPKAKIKTIKMTLVICTAFLCCWVPFFVFNVLDVYGYKSIEKRSYMVLSTLYPLNSLCNPLVFILFNTKLFFRSSQKQGVISTTHYDGISTQLTTT